MKILIVKLSSLGDVLHNCPIVWDLRRAYPDAQIDWVIEEGYVDLVQPLLSSVDMRGLDRVIPIALRRWAKDLKKGEFIGSIKEFLSFKENLQSVKYDLIIESQGLIKSAVVAAIAKKSPHASVIGLANQTEFSGYEPIARCFYTQSIQVPYRCHAVDRSRWLVAAACNQAPPDRDSLPPDFYPSEFSKKLSQTSYPRTSAELSKEHLGFDIGESYALFFHSTAREAKRWMSDYWIQIGRDISARGIHVVLPWGSDSEKLISDQLAKEIPNAIVPASFSIANAFYLVANARLTIGVDTGLTHLSAVLNRPTIELYCDSPRWKTEGYWSEKVINLGGVATPPTIDEVHEAVERLLG